MGCEISRSGLSGSLGLNPSHRHAVKLPPKPGDAWLRTNQTISLLALAKVSDQIVIPRGFTDKARGDILSRLGPPSPPQPPKFEVAGT